MHVHVHVHSIRRSVPTFCDHVPMPYCCTVGRSASSHSTRPGYSASGRGGSGCGQAGGVGEMKEHELLDLLSQYEEDVATPTWYSVSVWVRPHLHVQDL